MSLSYNSLSRQILHGDILEKIKEIPDESIDCIITSPQKEIIFAYLAGLVDGEAYIGIKKSNNKKNGSKSPQHHERIQIRMTEELAIQLFKKIYGGSYYKEKPEQHNARKPLYCYQASDKLASNILQQLPPFLLVKRKDAKLVLLLRDRKNQKRIFGRGIGVMSKEELKIREPLYQACKTLHGHVGGDD